MKKWMISLILTGLLFSSCASKPDLSRCLPATAQQITRIQEFLDADKSGLTLSNVYAIKSKDFAQVYMVSGLLVGPGMKQDSIAVWAMGGNPETPGALMSVDAVAKEFSGVALGSTTITNLTMESDGAEQAKNCALVNK